MKNLPTKIVGMCNFPFINLGVSKYNGKSNLLGFWLSPSCFEKFSLCLLICYEKKLHGLLTLGCFVYHFTWCERAAKQSKRKILKKKEIFLHQNVFFSVLKLRNFLLRCHTILRNEEIFTITMGKTLCKYTISIAFKDVYKKQNCHSPPTHESNDCRGSLAMISNLRYAGVSSLFYIIDEKLWYDSVWKAF